MEKELLNLVTVEELPSTNNIVKDVSLIINQTRESAYRSVDLILLRRNWLIGKRIYEEELKESRKENYGLIIMKNLSKQLVNKYGKGFDRSNLYHFYNFYKNYKKIFDTVCRQSFLSWSHYRLLLTLTNQEIRDWYENEAIKYNWSVRTLQRNIATDYYQRMLLAQDKELFRKALEKDNKPYRVNKLEFIKNPVILDFLEIPENNSFMETDLEKAIISHIQQFLLEMGKGYCFVGRQVRIHTEKTDYYIDLVFFNYILNCFVLIDLKKGKVTHQDVGQMNMYVRMYDELVKEEFHNPTLGIVLCDDTDVNVARYSYLKDNEQIFASKYKLCLPSEEELRKEIETQKTMYYLEHQDDKKRSD